MAVTSAKTRMTNFGYKYQEMTIGNVIADKAQKNGDKTFLHYVPDGRIFSYKDIDIISNRLGNKLNDLGFGKGAHIAVIMENCPEQMLLYFAIAKMGGVAIPVNTSARGKLLSYFLNQSDSIAVIAEAEFLERIADALPDCPAIRSVIYLPQPDIDAAGLVSRFSIPLLTYAELETGSEQAMQANVKFTDLAMLTYTSGTTGPSKGNMIAQATVIQYGISTAESHGYRFSDTTYICLPINHANAYLSALWGSLMADATVALSRRFSVSKYWPEIRTSGATLTNLLGSMVNMLWAQPVSLEDKNHKLRFCLISPVPKFALEWEKRFGGRVASSYGLTDFANATVYTILDPVSKLGSAGRPRAGIEIRIVDEDDLDVPIGEVGEIVLRSNNHWGISLGYYKMPEATAAAIRNLWWHTGDRASLDEDGYLFFADRKKDAIRRRGENISAYEVESIILEHSAVADAAVYPVTSEMSEEEVAVSVVLVEGAALTEKALVEYCIKNMAHYMVPRFVDIVADLPRTQSQKVQKSDLRAKAEKDRSALWDREKEGIIVKR